MPFVSFALAVIFIIRLFSISAFRVPNLSVSVKIYFQQERSPKSYTNHQLTSYFHSSDLLFKSFNHKTFLMFIVRLIESLLSDSGGRFRSCKLDLHCIRVQ